MYELADQYLQQLEEIATEIQGSELLEAYLESEEEEEYNALKDAFEPRIAEVYTQVALDHPLQLIALELVLLDSNFEGLFLPRILGYSVLRGEVNQNIKYVRPQEHFKEVVLAICESANFEMIKKRIGQSIQMGFGLSSDIWITNLIESQSNKRIRYYLQSQKLDKYLFENERTAAYQKYARQFIKDNYQCVQFPDNQKELMLNFISLKSFLLHRTKYKANNETLTEPIRNLVTNEALIGSKEHAIICTLLGSLFEMEEADTNLLSKTLNKVRKDDSAMAQELLAFIVSMHHDPATEVSPDVDKRYSALLDKKIPDVLSGYYELIDTIHSKGYNQTEVQDAIREYYNKHEGMSLENEGVRLVIGSYFKRFISNLEINEYPELFEIAKMFPVYMGIFGSESFNLVLRESAMQYVKRLLKKYVDKRGRDYQDIKKFVARTFVDLGFMKEKEVTELFKTRRKKTEL